MPKKVASFCCEAAFFECVAYALKAFEWDSVLKEKTRSAGQYAKNKNK